ncbi:hypothetical protein PIROE2DRAFT_59990 [Piromyces sp. E2]|nr:hypothetical protein PIROE2DRAFT_59990 [Piromyces sp. E2]|eukprot:OUM65486.1 hypothetical protein PIROE2DRAFT_59990 [Piromyces sp. E2]
MAKRKNQDNSFEIVKKTKIEEDNLKAIQNQQNVQSKTKNKNKKNKNLKKKGKNNDEKTEKKGKYITEDSMLKLIDTVNDTEESKINMKLTKQKARDEYFSQREQKLQQRKDEKKQKLNKKIIAEALESEKSDKSAKKTKRVKFAV